MGANISNASGAPEPKPRPTFRGVGDRKEHHEKKKKSSKLQTFKKKLVRTRRQSRSYDYCKLLRDYTSNWTVEELSSLVDDYESSLILKDLSTQADITRPPTKTLKEDLAQLFDQQICADVKLIYKNACYQVHRAIVCVRCGYFRELLKRHPEPQSEVLVEIKTQGVTPHLFRSVLRYLYTGEFNRCDNPGTNEILSSLCQEFGTPNLLEHDLRYLLETSEFCDTLLVFSAEDDDNEESLEGTKKLELPCHRALLCARSPFFRSIFARKAQTRRLEPVQLDETVIPRQYARVLLQSLYLDVVDMSCIVRSCGSTNSLSEVQAMVTGKGRSTHYDDAMDIFLIGRFVDFPSLIQGCEDLIVENLSVDTLNSILAWSSKPYGSDWVYRQALQYLNDEFATVASSGALSALPEKYLTRCLQSDFVQACEVDILAAVLKWGEDRLIKRIEEREPNILAHTAHSVSKKGVKKRDLNDSELRAILSGFMPYIRTEHIIPTSHELLVSCIKRGLISTPPSHMMADEGSIKRHHVWIRNNRSGIYTKPRVFLPFYEEFKTILKEQLSQLPGLGRRPVQTNNLSSIPDTLYMVSDASPYNAHHLQNDQSPYNDHHYHPMTMMTSSRHHQDDEQGGAVCFSMPDKETLATLLHREAELLQTPPVQKAYCNPLADKRALRHLVQLCTVRELGLPDVSVHVFRGVYDGRGRAIQQQQQQQQQQEGRGRNQRSRYSRHGGESERTRGAERRQSNNNTPTYNNNNNDDDAYRHVRTTEQHHQQQRGMDVGYVGTYPRSDRRLGDNVIARQSYHHHHHHQQQQQQQQSASSRSTSRSSPMADAYRSLEAIGAVANVRSTNTAEQNEIRSGPCGDLNELVPDIAMSTPSIAPHAEMARLSVNEEMDLDLVDGTRKNDMSVYI